MKERLLQGSLTINGKLLHQANKVEITPAGGGHYAIVARIPVREPVMLKPDEYHGKLLIKYENPLLPENLHFNGSLVDLAVEDAEGKVELSLLFKGQRVSSPLTAGIKEAVAKLNIVK